MHRMQEVLAVVPTLRTLFGRGILLETNKTLSRSTLTVQDMAVDEALSPSFRRLILLVASLRPSPGTATRVANEEKSEVLLPWGRALRSHGALLGTG